MKATTPLKKGSQAFISYGDKSNDELLQLFGFVEEDNPHDTFLSIGLDGKTMFHSLLNADYISIACDRDDDTLRTDALCRLSPVARRAVFRLSSCHG